MIRKLYMEVTRDQYQLPIKIYDNPRMIADDYGISINTVYSRISKAESGLIKYPQFVKVVIEE